MASNGDEKIVLDTNSSHTADEKVQPQVASSSDNVDVENNSSEEKSASKVSMFKSLGLLDRFLAVWIFLSMAVGIILGNFVDNVGPALKKGEFVGVSVPIGM